MGADDGDGDARGETVTVVTTPAVRDAARAHLGCDTLAGAEPEDSGGISSAACTGNPASSGRS